MTEKVDFFVKNKENVSCPHGVVNLTLHDCLYSPSHHIDGQAPNKVIEEFVSRMVKFSDDLKHDPVDKETMLDIKPGKADLESIDVYGADILSDNSPMVIFVHGGFWMEGSKEHAKSLVRTLVTDGVVVAVVGYKLCPNVTLPEIVEEVVQTIEYLINWSQKRESIGLHLMGHSAGAQLVCASLQKLSNDKSRSIKSLILISGIYNLKPLLTTTMNETLKLNETLANRLSPMNMIHEISGRYSQLKITVIVGIHDSPKFVEQSKDFFDLARRYFGQNSISLYILPDYHHFNIISGLGDKSEAVYKLVREKIFL